MSFAEVAANWRPEPETTQDEIDRRPAETFAAILDQPVPDELPPLWHWFSFQPIHRQSALGEDGHPADAAFTPPLENRRRMFGGGRLTVHRQLTFGQAVRRQASLKSVRVKQGSTGQLLLVTVKYDFLVGDQTYAVEEQDIIYRDAADMAARPQPAAEASHRGPWRLEIRPDPVLLFRFSALTNNAHRIHYDQPYTTEVEGHPGLVVHGPLLALLLLELPRRDGRRVTEFSWRAKRTLYDHQLVTVSGQPMGDTVELSAGAAGAPDAVTGIATLRKDEE
ncbi:FAS1-like dehydratase domain-containing protein [Fodinicola acaciae]|uniref:FAS1-like dehydratase domain-containing protein n=1 Tax=Fodinicola acaciae TaxID=2681555 RepID=UPI0013D86B84|nr:MaoC family dehydratase N-terminal domain-containing protein [Fodinicola acaciae]